MLRQKLGNHALFFYNALTPEVIGLVWRPTSFRPKAFSAVSSESVRPISDGNWKSDSMAMDNVKDFLRELHHTTRDLIVDIKILDDRSHKRESTTTPSKKKNTKKRALSKEVSESDSDAESMVEE